MYYAIRFSNGAWLTPEQTITYDYGEAMLTRDMGDLQPIVERLNVPLNNCHCYIVNVTERELRID